VGSKRSPWKFLNAYCDGGLNAEGYYQADGRSERADTELVKRLELVMIKRPRSVTWKDTPPKTRQVVRLDVGAGDAEDKASARLAKKVPSESTYYKALEHTLKLKTDAICENIVDGLAAGEKSVIWVLTRESVEIMASALEKATDRRHIAPMMRNRNGRLWATHGEAPVKSRIDLAAEFREHRGAGCIIATMDSMPESISLFGATTEHYAQLHYLPGPMVQSENRPYLMNTSRLHILYYIARGTIDERVLADVLPRIEAMDKIAGDKDAASMGLTLEKKQEALKDMWARLFSGGPDDGSVDLSSLTDEGLVSLDD